MADDRLGLAEAIRDALVAHAILAFEDAGLQGLCCEGAWEAAVSAMRRIDMRPLLDPAGTSRRAPEVS